MAHRASPDGLAVGLDPDEHFLDLARQESARLGISAIFRAGTVDNLHAETGYDLVYARFVLSHLPEPAEVIGQMVRVVHPGGMIVIEDVDFAGHFCYPPNAAFARYVALYQTAVRLRGADPDLGPRLPGILDDAGVESVHLDVILPAFREGEGKRMAWATMEGIQAVRSGSLCGRRCLMLLLTCLFENPMSRRMVAEYARLHLLMPTTAGAGCFPPAIAPRAGSPSRMHSRNSAAVGTSPSNASNESTSTNSLTATICRFTS